MGYHPPLCETNSYLLGAREDFLKVLKKLPADQRGLVYLTAPGIAQKALNERRPGKHVWLTNQNRYVDTARRVLDKMVEEGVLEKAILVADEKKLGAGSMCCRREGYRVKVH